MAGDLEVPDPVARKAELFDWLMSQFRGGSLMMDGTAYWTLPLSVLSGRRARTPQEAVESAHAQHVAWTAEAKQRASQSKPGA